MAFPVALAFSAVPMKSIDIGYNSVELVYMDIGDLRRSERKEPTQDIDTTRSEVGASLTTLTRPVNGRQAGNERDERRKGRSIETTRLKE
jgi:hypothetical protein